MVITVNKSICSECSKWRLRFPTCLKKCKKLKKFQAEDDLRRRTSAGYTGNHKFDDETENLTIVSNAY
jgi:hypothetical protein